MFEILSRAWAEAGDGKPAGGLRAQLRQPLYTVAQARSELFAPRPHTGRWL